jgi:hypothetical protein
MQNSTAQEGPLGTEPAEAITHKKVNPKPYTRNPKPNILIKSNTLIFAKADVGDSDDEPWEIRGSFSTTDHGQKHWQPHYFNHAFWSQLYHYFKGDKPTEYCNVCVGEFMTALQDIKDPSTGRHKHARAEQVPLMCQGVCESNQALGYKFHRQVPTDVC